MGKNILLIDDDEDEQLIFIEALKETNESVRCFCACTAVNGIKFLQQSLPDFVFLDINMPVLNGFACLNLIKKDQRLKKIPVIMYSTEINEAIACKAMREGAFSCVKKGHSISDLAITLKNLLSYAGSELSKPKQKHLVHL